jgi:hypothetical protein
MPHFHDVSVEWIKSVMGFAMPAHRLRIAWQKMGTTVN